MSCLLFNFPKSLYTSTAHTKWGDLRYSFQFDLQQGSDVRTPLLSPGCQWKERSACWWAKTSTTARHHHQSSYLPKGAVPSTHDDWFGFLCQHGVGSYIPPAQSQPSHTGVCIMAKHWVLGYGHKLIHKPLNSFSAGEAFPNTALDLREWFLRSLLGQQALISKPLSFACVPGTSLSSRLISLIPLSISAEESIIYHGFSLWSTLRFAITNLGYAERERRRERERDHQSQNPWAINVNICQVSFRAGRGPRLMLNIYWVPIMDEAPSDPLVEQPSGGIENAFLRE